MQLRPGLHRIPAPLGERFIALYLLEGPAGILLWDTGIASSITDTLLPYLAANAIPRERIRWAVNSHCDFDHTGGNAALLAAVPKVEFYAGADDVALTTDLQSLIDERYGEFRELDGFDDPPETTAYIRGVAHLVGDVRPLHGGEAFDLGDRVIEVLHTPGHSDGHLSLWDSERSALLIADAALGDTVPTAGGAPAFPPTYRDTDPYLASLRRFRRLDPELLLTAHYPVYEGESVGAFLDLSERYTDMLDDAIAGVLDDGGAYSTLELIHRIASAVGPWPLSAAEYLIFPVTGNLERMQRLGTVVVGDRDGRRTWRRSAS